MTQRPQPQREDKATKEARAKGEMRLLIIMAVFVVASIAGMLIIDHYGTARMGSAAHLKDAADR